jgi:hypothetical protein
MNIAAAKNIDSILKQILVSKGCSFGKYLSQLEYVNSKNEDKSVFFITPIATRTLKKVLVITKIVENNWLDSVKNIKGIIHFLNKHYNLGHKEYRIILHTYFNSINFEQFYVINSDSDDSIEKLSITEFEKILV